MSTKPPAPEPAKQPIDWAAIEADYRAGIKTLRVIAQGRGVSHVAIANRAKKEEWSRDLKKRIDAHAAQLVAKAELNKDGLNSTVNNRSGLETAIVQANGQAIFTVIMGQKKTGQRLLNLGDSLLGDLEVISSQEGQGLADALLNALTKPVNGQETPEQQRRRTETNRKTLERALSLDTRVDIYKRIVDAYARGFDIQRQAFGITDKTQTDPEAGKVLNDAERTARVAKLFASARERAAAAETITDVEPKNAS